MANLRETWSGEGFDVEIYISDALLYMRATGVAGLQSYYQAAAYAAGVGSQRPYAATVVDLRKCLLVVSESELLGMKLPKSALASKWRPGAWIVPLEFEDMFRRLALRLALEGFERAVFTSGSSALDWARAAATRARVRAALQASKTLSRVQGPLAFAPSGPGGL